jgi:L,D-transpeptidase catalytic domain
MKIRQGAKKMGKQSRRNWIQVSLQIGAVLLLTSLTLLGKDANIPLAQPKVQEMKPAVRVLVLSIPDRKLALIEDGVVLKTFDVAVGKPSTPSPSGKLKIINKVTNPTYYHKGEVIKPGKGNPLGNRWMGLSQKGYGIHGTNVQSSVGKAESHGCFRMRKHDVEELFTLVRVGDTVQIHQERDEQVAAIFADPAKSVTPVPQTSVAHALLPAPPTAGSAAGAK